MIYQTITKISEKKGVDVIFERILNTNLSGIRFNLCKYKTNEIELLLKNIKEYKDKGLKFFFDVPYPKNKVRISGFKIDQSSIQESKVYILTSNSLKYSNLNNVIFIDKEDINVSIDDVIYYADGQGAFTVKKIISTDSIEIKALNDFKIYPNKGLSCGFIKNVEFIKVIEKISNEFPHSGFLLSFIENGKEIIEVKKKVNSSNEVIAKIESKKALENLDNIISVSDGVLIARGDLALNTPFERLLEYTEKIHLTAKNRGKKVLSATDILRYSDFRLVPERSELIDIQNMAKLGTDIVILPSDFDLVSNDMNIDIVRKINRKIEIINTCFSNFNARGRL